MAFFPGSLDAVSGLTTCDWAENHDNEPPRIVNI